MRMYTMLAPVLDGTNKNLVLAAYDETTNKLIKFDELLENGETLIPNLGHNIKLDSDAVGTVPYLVQLDNNSVQLVKVIPILETLKTKGEEYFTQTLPILLEKVLPMFGGASREETDFILREIADVKKQLFNYIDGKVNYNINMKNSDMLNLVRTLPLVKELSKQSSVSSALLSDETKNKTEFMRTPADRTFLQVPTPGEFAVGEFVLPKRSDVFNPYPRDEYFTPEYFKYVTTPEQRVLIEGDSANNDLPLQDNEKEWIEALKELVNIIIEEERPGQLESCIKIGKTSPRVLDYFTSLITKVASWNWGHSGRIPIGYEDDEDDEDGDDSQSESMESNLVFNAQTTSLIDGIQVIRGIFNDISTKNIYAPIEFIVRSMRWGARKPSRIFIPELGRYFEYSSLLLTSTSGNLSSMVVEEVNGCTLSLDSVIYSKGSIQDISYIDQLGYINNKVDMPVGFVCSKKFEGGFTQRVYVPITDYLLDYMEGDLRETIDGVKIDGNTVSFREDLQGTESVIDLEQLMSLISNDHGDSYKFYQSSSMMDVILEYAERSKGINTLDIINTFLYLKKLRLEIETNEFSNKDEFKENLASLGVPVSKLVQVTLASSLFPVLLDANDTAMKQFSQTGDLPELGEYVTLIYNRMRATGYTGDISDKSAFSDNSKNVATGDLASMDIFGDTAKTVDGTKLNVPTQGVTPPAVDGTKLNIPSQVDGTKLNIPSQVDGTKLNVPTSSIPTSVPPVADSSARVKELEAQLAAMSTLKNDYESKLRALQLKLQDSQSQGSKVAELESKLKTYEDRFGETVIPNATDRDKAILNVLNNYIINSTKIFKRVIPEEISVAAKMYTPDGQEFSVNMASVGGAKQFIIAKGIACPDKTTQEFSDASISKLYINSFYKILRGEDSAIKFDSPETFLHLKDGYKAKK